MPRPFGKVRVFELWHVRTVDMRVAIETGVAHCAVAENGSGCARIAFLASGQ